MARDVLVAEVIGFILSQPIPTHSFILNLRGGGRKNEKSHRSTGKKRGRPSKTPKKGVGRPKGSKNKKTLAKSAQVDEIEDDSDESVSEISLVQPAKKKRGSSKTKKTLELVQEDVEMLDVENSANVENVDLIKTDLRQKSQEPLERQPVAEKRGKVNVADENEFIQNIGNYVDDEDFDPLQIYNEEVNKFLEELDVEKVVDHTYALKERSEELKFGRLAPKLPLQYVPGIDENEWIQGDNITFALMDYIRDDDRPIGLMSVGIWEEKTRKEVGSENPIDYLIVRPKQLCKYLVVPIWKNGHYMVAIMHCSDDKKVVSCYYIDSARLSVDHFIQAGLVKIAQSVFQFIAQMPSIEFRFMDISHESVQQNFSEDWVNCAAFATHNAIEFLERQKLPPGLDHLRPTDKNGYDMRYDLFCRVIELYGFDDREKSFLDAFVRSKMPVNFGVEQADISDSESDSDHASDNEPDNEPDEEFQLQDNQEEHSGLPAVLVSRRVEPLKTPEFLPKPVDDRPGMQLRGRKIVRREVEIKKVKPLPGRKRGRPTFDCAAAIPQKISPEPISAGTMNHKCQYCGAYITSFQSEGKCCRSGRVVMEPFVPYPNELNKLLCDGPYLSTLNEKEKNDNKWFKENMRAVGALLGFASMTYETKDSGVKRMNPPVLANGASRPNISRITPLNKDGPKLFGQLYTLETPIKEEILEEFKKNEYYTRMNGGSRRDRIVHKLYSMVRERNPLAKGYLMAYDRIKQLKDTAFSNYKIIFCERDKVPAELDTGGEHDRQLNLPVVPEAAMLFQPLRPGEAAPPCPNGVWMYSTERIPKVHLTHLPVILSLTNPLMFLHGELPYSLNLPLRNVEQSDDEEDNDEDDGEFYDFEELLNRAHIRDRKRDNSGIDRTKESKRKIASIREQVLFRMHRRDSDNGIHHIWNWRDMGKLLVIRMHFEVVRREIEYHNNVIQKRVIKCDYVRENAQKLLDKHMKGEQLGYIARIPKYHKLSESYRENFYKKAIAMTGKLGSPTFFITVTGNPKWPEYLEECKKHVADPNNAPDIMMAVFEAKLKKYIELLTGPKDTRKGVLGKCIAYLLSIEYQKRGNPHAHILLWIEDEEQTADYVDKFISARIPNKEEDKELYDLVVGHMTHLCKADSVCRDKETGLCTKHYPQREYLSTQVGDGYVKYKRVFPRHGGQSTKKGGVLVTDAHVVPHNPYLLKAWNGHCNVEYVVNKRCPAYVIKYVLKGSSKIFIEILQKGFEGNPYITKNKDGKIDIDEAKYFLKLNYISAEEAIGNLKSFGPFMLSHNVIWIAAHLPGDLNIVCGNGEEIEKIVKLAEDLDEKMELFGACSRLTAYFKYCSDHPEETKNLTYVGLNEVYKYNPKTYSYTPAGRATKRIVAMYDVNIKNKQLLALRTILLYVPGLKSFEDAAVFDDNCYITPDNKLDFVGAAKARGFLESDLLWRNALDQRLNHIPRRMIYRFAQILIDAGHTLESPRQLWEDYKQYMILPLGPLADEDTAAELRRLREEYALSILRWHLEDANLTLKEFGLPEPTDPNLPAFNPNVHGREAIGYLNGDFAQVDLCQNIQLVDLNEEQKFAVDQIWEALMKARSEKSIQEPVEFFLTGPAGTGKTTIYNQINKRCQDKGLSVINNASTGIAATLLPNGTTLHSTFFIPIGSDIHKDPRMPAECSNAKRIRECALLIVDEATQISQDVYNYLKATLLNVRKSNHPEVERRLVIVFGGDFRQLLPVVTKGNEQDCFNASLIGKYADKSMRFLCLKKNQRAGGEDQEAFRNFLLKVGKGSPDTALNSSPFRSLIKLPETIKQVHDLPDLIEEIFPKDQLNDPSSWASCAIITSLNASVDLINEKLINMLDGEAMVYEALNVPDPETVSPFDETHFEAMTEVMGKVDETGLPRQRLVLKVGTPVLFTTNRAKNYGVCNGVKAVVVDLQPDVITVRRVNPNGTLGEYIDVLRSKVKREINLQLKRLLSFTRVQFPLVPAFAMTIHKAQGQTLSRVGLFLNSPMFAPGQLYVALSRTRTAESIVVFDATAQPMIENVVHPGVREFLDAIENDPEANPFQN